MSEKLSKRLPFHKRFLRRIKHDNERGARESVLEDLFNDFNRNRFTIYKFNFFRGIFFGLGSVIGGTIVIALLIWIFSLLGHVFPPLDHFFNGAVDTIQSGKK